MKSELVRVMSKELEAIESQGLPFIGNITSVLGVPRDVLASDEEIVQAWSLLPREIERIPPNRRSELLARMCVAISTGLFDGAVNYMWNASIQNLREKIRHYGFSVVTDVVGHNFTEEELVDKKDADLLTLCLQLNLINEDGYFFLDQCRAVRNNYSAAHPSAHVIDEMELLSYIRRCARYALSDEVNPKGVFVQEFIGIIKGPEMTQDQEDLWVERLSETHDAQREMLFETLHGIYCDPSTQGQSRSNALRICTELTEEFTPTVESKIINKHYEYRAKGEGDRALASETFLEKLGLLGLLNDIDIHKIISTACSRLVSVHQAMNNFYNEPPFAERLCELVAQNSIPDTVKEEYVEAIVTCRIGNGYGVSNAAIRLYDEMIDNLTPKEKTILLHLHEKNSLVGDRIRNITSCRIIYRNVIKSMERDSLTGKQINLRREYLRI